MLVRAKFGCRRDPRPDRVNRVPGDEHVSGARDAVTDEMPAAGVRGHRARGTPARRPKPEHNRQ